MVLLVPYDGSDLSKTALKRAAEFGDFRAEEVVALTIVPEDESFARERGWVAEGDPVDIDAICSDLEAEVRAVAPDARVICERPESSESYVSTLRDDVVRTIRETAADLGTSVVFVGSENAARVSNVDESVGDPVSEDPRYDVHIVRHPE